MPKSCNARHRRWRRAAGRAGAAPARSPSSPRGRSGCWGPPRRRVNAAGRCAALGACGLRANGVHARSCRGGLRLAAARAHQSGTAPATLVGGMLSARLPAAVPRLLRHSKPCTACIPFTAPPCLSRSSFTLPTSSGARCARCVPAGATSTASPSGWRSTRPLCSPTASSSRSGAWCVCGQQRPAVRAAQRSAAQRGGGGGVQCACWGRVAHGANNQLHLLGSTAAAVAKVEEAPCAAVVAPRLAVFPRAHSRRLAACRSSGRHAAPRTCCHPSTCRTWTYSLSATWSRWRSLSPRVRGAGRAQHGQRGGHGGVVGWVAGRGRSWQRLWQRFYGHLQLLCGSFACSPCFHASALHPPPLPPSAC